MDFNSWAQQSDTVKVYLVETSARQLSDGSELPLYFATQDIVLNDRFYLGCVTGLPRLTRASDSILTPGHVSSWGELELLLEMDYRPDPGRTVTWLDLLSGDYTFQGQPLVIKLGGDPALGFTYADFQTIFAGYLVKPDWTDTQATFTVADRAAELARKVPDYQLPQTPVDANGVAAQVDVHGVAVLGDGVDEVSWGQTLPIVLGAVKNYKPVLITSANRAGYAGTSLAYAYLWKYGLACHCIQSIDNVYMGGVRLDPSYWVWVQKDLSPVTPDQQGAAQMAASGSYSGALTARQWLVQIDSVAAGAAIGQATFRW